MFNKYRIAVSSRAFSTIFYASAVLFAASQVQAGSIVPCGADVCSSDFAVQFEGREMGGGQLLYDANTGDISLNLDPASISNGTVVEGTSIMWTMGDGSTIRVNSLGGNADPILIFGLGASTSGSGASFGFTFDLPIALQGPIDANSSVSYSLTSRTGAGAQIQNLGGKVVTALEVDSDVGGLGVFNKGVDVGDTFFFTGGPQTQNSPVYTASSSFTGNLAYDLMTVQVDFNLSPNSAVGLSGFVEQVLVPVPAAVWLFGSGLLGLVAVARRRSR